MLYNNTLLLLSFASLLATSSVVRAEDEAADKGNLSFASKDQPDEIVDEEESVDMWIVWAAVIGSIVFTILTVIIVHFATKGKTESGKLGAVSDLKAATIEEKTPIKNANVDV